MNIRYRSEDYNSESSVLFREFLKKYDIVKIKTFDLPWTKVCKKLYRKKVISVINPPYWDHAMLLTKSNGDLLLTYQPYGPMDNEMKLEINKWCVPRGLKASFNKKESFHYPSHTFLVMLEVKNENRLLDYFSKNFEYPGDGYGRECGSIGSMCFNNC